jgi:hypothetical protein
MPLVVRPERLSSDEGLALLAAGERRNTRPPAALESSALDQLTASSMDWLARAAVIGAKSQSVGGILAAVGLVERLVDLQGTSFGRFGLLRCHCAPHCCCRPSHSDHSPDLSHAMPDNSSSVTVSWPTLPAGLQSLGRHIAWPVRRTETPPVAVNVFRK